MADKVAETVLRIIAEQARLPVESLALTASPADIGLDSLGLVEMVFAIEEAFDIAVPFNSNTGAAADFDISTIATVVAAVRALVDAKPA